MDHFGILRLTLSTIARSNRLLDDSIYSILTVFLFEMRFRIAFVPYPIDSLHSEAMIDRTCRSTDVDRQVLMRKMLRLGY